MFTSFLSALVFLELVLILKGIIHHLLVMTSVRSISDDVLAALAVRHEQQSFFD